MVQLMRAKVPGAQCLVIAGCPCEVTKAMCKNRASMW